MNAENFKKLVADYICPMLSGAEISEEIIESNRSHDLAALQGNGQTMHLSPSKQEDYKIAIRRNQTFNGADTRIVKAVLNEVVEMYDKNSSVYHDRVIGYAIEVGICKFLSATHDKVLVDILQGFEEWSTRTYEGRKPSFSIIVDFNNNQENNDTYPSIKEVLREDFSALLSNSVESALVVSSGGALENYDNLQVVKNDSIYSPFRFLSFANAAKDNKICLTLTNNGDILIFKEEKLFFL